MDVSEFREKGAAIVHATQCGCADWTVDDQEDLSYREVADALVPLFQQVAHDAWAEGWDQGATEAEHALNYADVRDETNPYPVSSNSRITRTETGPIQAGWNPAYPVEDT